MQGICKECKQSFEKKGNTSSTTFVAISGCAVHEKNPNWELIVDGPNVSE